MSTITPPGTPNTAPNQIPDNLQPNVDTQTNATTSTVQTNPDTFMGALQTQNSQIPASAAAGLPSDTPPVEEARFSKFLGRVPTSSDAWDMYYFGAKLGFSNAFKDLLRQELTKARNAMNDGDDTGELDKKAFQKKRFCDDPMIINGELQIGPPIPAGMATTKAELEAYIEDLETQLQTTGEDYQLMLTDFQIATQRYQEGIQQKSNISAQAHDTTMSITRNIS